MLALKSVKMIRLASLGNNCEKNPVSFMLVDLKRESALYSPPVTLACPQCSKISETSTFPFSNRPPQICRRFRYTTIIQQASPHTWCAGYGHALMNTTHEVDVVERRLRVLTPRGLLGGSNPFRTSQHFSRPTHTFTKTPTARTPHHIGHELTDSLQGKHFRRITSLHDRLRLRSELEARAAGISERPWGIMKTQKRNHHIPEGSSARFRRGAIDRSSKEKGPLLAGHLRSGRQTTTAGKPRLEQTTTTSATTSASHTRGSESS
ncbi:hypothetical protein MTO96_039203 [Rhipicephalus appendiculatus]